MRPKTFRPIARALVLVGLALLAAGCATAPGRGAGQAPAPVEGVRIESGAIDSAYGCAVRYEYYEPHETGAARVGVEPGLVVIGHGFMRDLTAMRGWAAEWSARGHRAVVVSFCNSGWFNGRHDRNAEDLVAVARHISPGTAPIVYAGFSAGGLSALLAAAGDPHAIAWLGLDPVDSGDLASEMARLRMPALAIVGAPSRCNADGNITGVLPEAAPMIALRIPGATHCDFENPHDPACARVCGRVEPPQSAEEISRTISSLATAWVELQLGAAPEAARVFTRANLDELERSGRVEVLRFGR
jgi:hypothetical protein